MLRRVVVGSVAVLAVVAAPGSAARAAGRPGTLDPTFSRDGVQTVQVQQGHNEARGLTVQGNGRIIVAGASGSSTGRADDFAVARLLSGGGLDGSFGKGGHVTTDFGGDDEAFDVTRAPGGKIVAAGVTQPPRGRASFAVARYMSDGALDRSFDGDGTVRVVFPQQSARAHAVAVDGSGRVVVAGTAIRGQRSAMAIVRLLANGGLDPSFGSNGRVVLDPGFSTDELDDVAVLDDGRIVAAGTSYEFIDDGRFAVLRLLRNGKLDRTFAGDGMRIVNLENKAAEGAQALAPTPDGGLLVGGTAEVSGTRTGFVFVRFKRGGATAAGFGNRGVARPALSSRSETLSDLALSASGRFVAVGSVARPVHRGTLQLVARFLAGGDADPSYGEKPGYTITDLGGVEDTGEAVAVDGAGRTVAAGTTAAGAQSSFAVTRYRG